MQLEISLPDEDGRLQIFNIHTSKMAASKKLSSDVDLKELAAKTKNFSGAEIEGLCRAAAFTAMYRLVKVSEQFHWLRLFYRSSRMGIFIGWHFLNHLISPKD